MSATVDVRSVIGQAAALLDAAGESAAALSLLAAGYAVAELIAAADAVPRCSYCEHDAEWDRLSAALNKARP